jgi:histidine ammonia-lyase
MTVVRIGEDPLTPAAVVAAARGGAIDVELTAAARERIVRSRLVAEELAGRQPVYGRTTGVGANRHVAVQESDLRVHSVRLLRSHAGGVGDALPDELVRATLLIRLAQMAAGGGGHRPEIADALAQVLRTGPLPVLRDLGGIGTGDLTLLAQLGLALAGEGEWAERATGALAAREAPTGSGPTAGGEAARGAGLAAAGQVAAVVEPPAAPPRVEIEAGDALALMSSNAATHAAAALAWADARELLDAGLGIAALAFHALDGNREAFAPEIAAVRPLPGLTAVSERLRVLTQGAPEPARMQDPFGLRCLPPVAGALHDAAASLHDVLAVEINAAAENPLIAAGEALHHGGFHAAPIALALDTLRLALVPFASMSAARISHMMEPGLSGLTPFLSVDAPGSSGLLIAEYLAADALARLRGDAAPAVLGTVAISRGLEEHASFAWQGAGRARHAVLHLRTVLALEWVVAERALRMKAAPVDGVLGPIRALATGFDARLEDRPIGPDVALAGAALPALARAVRAALR